MLSLPQHSEVSMQSNNQIKEIPFPIPEQFRPPESRNLKAWFMGECSVIYSYDADRHHLSIAHPKRYPTWDEIKEARYRFLPGDCYMAMMFPPKEYWLNVHKNAFHLWEVKELKLQWICRQM